MPRPIRTAARVHARSLATTALDAVSAALIVTGAHMVYAPAGWVAAGVAGLAISWRFTLRPEDAAAAE